MKLPISLNQIKFKKWFKNRLAYLLIIVLLAWSALIIHMQPSLGLLSSNSGFMENILAELLGITAEILIIYLVIDALIKDNEDRKWAQIRDKIYQKIQFDAKKLDFLFSRIFGDFNEQISQITDDKLEANQTARDYRFGRLASISSKDIKFNYVDQTNMPKKLKKILKLYRFDINGLRDELQYLSVSFNPSTSIKVYEYMEKRMALFSKISDWYERTRLPINFNEGSNMHLEYMTGFYSDFLINKYQYTKAASEFFEHGSKDYLGILANDLKNFEYAIRDIARSVEEALNHDPEEFEDIFSERITSITDLEKGLREEIECITGQPADRLHAEIYSRKYTGQHLHD